MQTRNIRRWLLVTVAVLVVGVGGAAAHAGVGPLAGDHAGADSGRWIGAHTADSAGYYCDGVGEYGGMMGPAGGYGMTGGGLWGLGSLVPLLLIGLAIVVGYVLVTRSGSNGTDPARELLRQRYASGELSEEEFAARREALRG